MFPNETHMTDSYHAIYFFQKLLILLSPYPKHRMSYGDSKIVQLSKSYHGRIGHESLRKCLSQRYSIDSNILASLWSKNCAEVLSVYYLATNRAQI